VGAPSDLYAPADPYRSAGNTVFWGAGIDQQNIYTEGIYASLFGTLTKIADLTTAIPGVTGKFYASAPVIFGGNVAFIGKGDGNQGIYVRLWQSDLIRIADLSTDIPGRTDKFSAFPARPSISGQNVVFVGGNKDWQGVYKWPNPVLPPNPIRIADLNTDIPTKIPDDTGKFAGFPPDPMIFGNNIAFIGNDSDGQQGVYAVVLPPNPIRIAHRNTLIPGGSGYFNAFSNIALGGTSLALVGGVASYGQDNIRTWSQQGVYASSISKPFEPSDPIGLPT
jgi:hypothetical protein